jgi:hypothetical protein
MHQPAENDFLRGVERLVADAGRLVRVPEVPLPLRQDDPLGVGDAPQLPPGFLLAPQGRRQAVLRLLRLPLRRLRTPPRRLGLLPEPGGAAAAHAQQQRQHAQAVRRRSASGPGPPPAPPPSRNAAPAPWPGI